MLSLLLPAKLLHCPLASFLSAGGNRGLFLLDQCSVMYFFFYFLQAWEVNKPHIWLRTVALTARNAQLRFYDHFSFSKFIRIHWMKCKLSTSWVRGIHLTFILEKICECKSVFLCLSIDVCFLSVPWILINRMTMWLKQVWLGLWWTVCHIYVDPKIMTSLLLISYGDLAEIWTWNHVWNSPKRWCIFKTYIQSTFLIFVDS